MIELTARDGEKEQLRIWEWLFEVIERLGVDGMSSDESDIDESTARPVFRVKVMTWRRDIEAYLKIVDEQRNDPEIFKPQGSLGEVRHRSAYNNRSSRRPVSGLPRAFYDDTWFESMSEERRFLTVNVSEEEFEWLEGISTE